ncbi:MULTISPECIES: dihydrolipoyl dehydrogenase [Microbacterium]|jgi:dihydrolipoamide dehydrogenase|uniref:Dihydrolipoyl dehydrogenase n=1 Tax=Microbacterium aurugineum TaxID=2851642 RepID=A0ABY4IXF3_9MICO|nr:MULTISPECIES: dihydrolipoyl dehydrogenase [Microbacterium]PKQ35162.1 MAG: dihydrolipoyl dehydrogenase [Actinobacteria bacterium HGW-Actinobacteria-11]MCK8465619.1 dihydrolipoyl dehydrogenase [Microbacterium aurugineum]MCZ4302773.1 dihydrolipoyl dehydrogenase [Microbacterium oxydans]QEA30032.1 dihydrolipoyl dehydrogenase [Microbacterium sp. CBA3102]TCJ29284.1 dihydrolipoyl dehydrogenase [Microbacterium sp. PI-1]
MPHYDVVILGAGPGGYVAAVRSAQLGLSTAIIEEKYWGGVCLNVGCIPSKALLKNAELAHTLNHKADFFGISGEFTIDFGKAFDRSREVAEGRVKGIHFLMKKNKVTEYNGRGTFTGPKAISVAKADGTSEEVTFDNAIIATGSKVRLLPGVTLSENVVTYEEQIMTRELPKSIVIVGAGAIGMEFAYVMTNYGVKVTIIEFLDRALPNEDADVSKEITKQYKNYGVDILTSTKVETVVDNGSSVTVTYTGKDGQQSSIEADKVLMSVGFAPNIEGFGLDKTGVKLTERGAIDIDDHMRTNVEGIYAIGDVTAKLQLAHVAEAQGVVAAETIGGAETQTLGDYRMMPRATFCSPQVASFGLTEQQAKDEGREIKVATFPFMANGKAHGLGEPVGFVKLIADAEHLELIGAHMIGPDVSELLPELTLAQKWDLTALELARNVHTHPTLSEALQEGFHGLAGHMINF